MSSVIAHVTVRQMVEIEKEHCVSISEAHRYKCLRCKRTFRVYPVGVTQAQTYRLPDSPRNQCVTN
jgi:hypothetical protein